MKKNELISIIVPIYKVEPYLHKCIDSILNQTYKNLQIILVDDGSPDRCGEICDQYAKTDKRINVIHKENGGLSDARNCGIDVATGKYLSFLDSDDWLHNEYIEKLYELLKSSKSDISACDFLRTSTEKVHTDYSNQTVYEFSNIEALEQYTDGFYVQMVVAWGKLYKRKLFEGIRFPVGRIHEDEFTTHRLLYKAKKVVYTTAQLLYYRQREDSIMKISFNINQKLDALDSYEERSAFFEAEGLTELSDKTYLMEFDLCLSYIDEIYELNDKLSEGLLIERLKKIKDTLILKNLHIDMENAKQAKAFKTILPVSFFNFYQ